MQSFCFLCVSGNITNKPLMFRKHYTANWFIASATHTSLWHSSKRSADSICLTIDWDSIDKRENVSVSMTSFHAYTNDSVKDVKVQELPAVFSTAADPDHDCCQHAWKISAHSISKRCNDRRRPHLRVVPTWQGHSTDLARSFAPRGSC
jgi:hypothetical protein